MGVIYITENLFNKSHGIIPWRYIGSDQYNDSGYLGSSRALKTDILNFGIENFTKTILEDLGNIDNKLLRKIESEKYLKPNSVRTDKSYYNKSESYSPGCGQKGMKHTKPRSDEHKLKIVEHRTGSTKDDSARLLMRERKLGKKAQASTKEKMSTQRTGEKNSNALIWQITTPSGETATVRGLRHWARINNYKYSEIYDNKNGWIAVKTGAGKGGRKKKEQNIGN